MSSKNSINPATARDLIMYIEKLRKDNNHFRIMTDNDIRKLRVNHLENTDAYFQRLNSCISIPQDEILVALREDNLRLFSDLINEDDLDLNYEYKEENHSTLLHLCLTVSYVMSRTKLIFLRIF